MHSVTLDSSGSPKKRTLSRGLSEDESLRSIIKETESSSRRLPRSESRAGTLKRRSDSQSDQELFMGLPEMLELQASYDEVVQELRGMEVEREALLFQVDVLQDTLEGVEELLAEAQREAGQASVELEQERQAKRKLESLVGSLMEEVQRLKEEKNNKPTAPVNMVDEAIIQGRQIKNYAKELNEATHKEEKDTSQCETHSIKSNKVEPAATEEDGEREEDGVLMKLRRMVNKPLGHLPSLALDGLMVEDGVLQRPCENGQDLSSDKNDSDSISAYEDAFSGTPEEDRLFPGDGEASDLPLDSENKEEGPTNNGQANCSKMQDPKNPDGCTLS
ncbi:leucine-rich repeat flightless-interacting protein 1 isoform X2 [Parambassis ranga]|uniref:Leucine-rich repeat flightless-interacting protein 1 isoform X2 n=1 Tax=Parambassis ranga TaxID=210632 RepID=A0A6P7I0E4_9TELE|nr:leucine-rich repeat flightless-interacting protein 1-like isoform X2 [Parambassis ranga]